MSNRIRFGLIIGAMSLIVTAFWSAFIGMCWPIVPMIAGGIAGYLAVRKEMPIKKRAGGMAGATSGIVVGGFSLIGYIIGWITSFAFRSGTYYLQSMQVSPITYAINSLFGEQGIILLFSGLIGMVLAGIAGFAGDSLGSRQSTPVGQNNSQLGRNADKTRRKGFIFGVLGSIVAIIIACFLVSYGLTSPNFKSAEQLCFGMTNPLATLDCLSRAQSSFFITTVIPALIVGLVTFYLILRRFNKHAKNEESEKLTQNKD